MARHLRSFHKEEYNLLQERISEGSNVTELKRKRDYCLHNVQLNAGIIEDACIEIVSVNGRPFSLIEDSGFRRILNPVLAALPKKEAISISTESTHEMVLERAESVKTLIKDEIEGKLLCLKVDIASRQGRSFLGVNVQFVRKSQLQTRTIAVKEISERSSSEVLLQTVKSVLQDFDIAIENVYSFILNNGSNMLPFRCLLKQVQGDVFKSDGEEGDDENDDFRSDSIDKESNFDDDSSKSKDIQTSLNKDLQMEECLTGNLTGAILDCAEQPVVGIRCVAHILQLSVDDAIKSAKIQSTLNKARAAAVEFGKASSMISIREIIPSAKKPVLDVEARWQSTFGMLESLLECKPCKFLLKKSKLTDEDWHLIDTYVKALKPAKIAVKMLQKEHLLLSEFFYYWSVCKTDTRHVDSNLAKAVADAMERRESLLMENETLLAALYLDPRYNAFLTRSQEEKAEIHLLSLWKRLHLQSQQESAEASSNSDKSALVTLSEQDSAEESERHKPHPLIDFLRKGKQLKAITQSAENESQLILTSLRSFLAHETLDPTEPDSMNLLQFWHGLKFKWPQLYELSLVVFAAFATQISVKKLFSAMRFFMSPLKSNLKSDALHAIMLLRCNKDIWLEENVTQRKRSKSKSSTSEASN